MKSKREEAKATKKRLMCPVFFEDSFRSETRKETDEVILFDFIPSEGPHSRCSAVPTPLSCALALHSECYSFFTVVPCWERCDPLQPIHPAHISYKPSSVSGPELGPPGGWIRGSVCLQSAQRPEGEVVKPPVLTSALPEVGSGGSGSVREGHLIEAVAAGVGKTPRETFSLSLDDAGVLLTFPFKSKIFFTFSLSLIRD